MRRLSRRSSYHSTSMKTALMLFGAWVMMALTQTQGANERTFLVEEEFSFGNQQHQGNRQQIRTGNSTSCSALENCFDCTAIARCHWCRSDQKCHVIGSLYGCLTGMKCSDDNGDDATPDDDDKRKPGRDHCNSYSTCSECASYRSCHWCAHDDSCHTIGSVYGCSWGVDCYSNDRCKRDTAEPLPSEIKRFTNMGLLNLLLVTFIGTLAFLCATCCLCCACGIKGAYDDLSSAASRGNRDDSGTVNNHRPGRGTPSASLTAALLSDATMDANTTDNSNAQGVTTEGLPSASQPEESEEGQDDTAPQSDYPPMGDDNDGDRGGEASNELEEVNASLLPSRAATATTIVRRTRLNRNGSKHARRLMSVCTCLYVLILFAIGGVMYGAARFYPKVPQYSVCNDNIAWKKLIDKMASFTVEVDFEILMSISNENHFDVSLDMGRGTFKHSGESIGQFIIRPVRAPAMAITDILIIASLEPDKWEAMSLTAEYYEGKLILDVDAQLNVRAPAFFNFSKEVIVTDKQVYINQKADRHLCACKPWNGNSTRHYDDIHFLRSSDFDGLRLYN